jgi:hypothetical protein
MASERQDSTPGSDQAKRVTEWDFRKPLFGAALGTDPAWMVGTA